MAIERIEAVMRSRGGARPLAPDAFITRSEIRSSQFPELDCIRAWLSKETAASAEWRALKVGTGADRVLIGAGRLNEEIY